MKQDSLKIIKYSKSFAIKDYWIIIQNRVDEFIASIGVPKMLKIE